MFAGNNPDTGDCAGVAARCSVPVREVVDTAELAGLPQWTGPALLHINPAGASLALHMLVRPAHGADAVVVLGHPALVRRPDLELPAFFGAKLAAGTLAHTILISDPGLALSPDLTTSWYLDDSVLGTTNLLANSLSCLSAGVGRVVFTGASAAGFAMLRLAWSVPGSFVLAVNPQTSLRRYHRDPVRRLAQAIWPYSGPDSYERLLADPQADVIPRWTQAGDSPDLPQLVYAQNVGDEVHLRDQLEPFAAALGHSTSGGTIPVDPQGRPLAGTVCQPRPGVSLAFGGWGTGHLPPDPRDWASALATLVSLPGDLARARAALILAGGRPRAGPRQAVV